VASFAQTGDNDLFFENGRLRLIRGAEEKAQKIRNRLQLFRGEWFLDVRVGVPYFASVFIKAPDLELVKRIFRRAIMSVEGVADVLDVVVKLNPDRSLDYAFRAVDDEGTEISGGAGQPFIVREQ
jgi:hypothetical protein